jgi:hypothetical protein
MSGFRRRAALTGSALSSTLSRWTQPGFVMAVQRGTVTITSGNVSGTATITSVVTANTRFRFLGCNDSGVDAQPSLLAKVALTNATTVTATVNTAPTNNLVVGFEVTEYYPGILKSVQRGTITVTGGTGTNTASITTVVTQKSELAWLGATVASTARDIPWLTLTNATTVTATNVSGSSTAIVGYEVAEWY